VSGIVNQIFDLFARFGSEAYGEDISLERHMLQSAAQAQTLGAPRDVVVAALLHDIGYFLQSGGEGIGDEHEALGALWLSRAFPERVTAPIALHVQAKRYLCAVGPAYYGQLSDASRLSLARQGGVMNDAEAAAFARHPAFDAALVLRRCDDGGKDTTVQTQSLDRYRGLLTESLRQPG
jgi:[1-hydroxy-2-(trimethylamino)ethyl]phosphonate dioxygenase